MRGTGVGITSAALATLLLAGSAAGQCCGDCNGDGEVTVNELVTAVIHALGSCSDDGICSMSSCPDQLATCRTDLATCQSQPGGQRFPASGQTTAYGPGSDGDVRAGGALAYTDNGDGTITDNNTRLMWEKKDQSGGIHDWNNVYSWSADPAPLLMNGTMVTAFLSTLNAAPCFAGQCDWRIPNQKELQSLVNYQNLYPAIGALFNASCLPNCTAATCSCTQSYYYWSSTTYQGTPGQAWLVDFNDGSVNYSDKSSEYFVLAVRGG